MRVHANATTAVLDATDAEAGESGAASAPRRVETDRLVLRRAHSDHVDVDRLHALFGDVRDGVLDRCGWDAHADDAATRTYLDERAAEWERGERYEYVLEADGEYVGTTCIERNADESGEFGLWIRETDWGRGFAGEQADATLHVAFAHLEMPYVVAGCLASNAKSRRAIEKFVGRYGGAYYGSAPVTSAERRDGDGPDVVPHHEWVVTREQYESAESGLSTWIPGVDYDTLDFPR